MVKIEETEKVYEYLGLKTKLQTATFRMKDLNEVLDLANKWMKEHDHFESTFIGFEFRPDLNSAYVARIRDSLGTHLDGYSVIYQVGSQWKASLSRRKII